MRTDFQQSDTQAASTSNRMHDPGYELSPRANLSFSLSFTISFPFHFLILCYFNVSLSSFLFSIFLLVFTLFLLFIGLTWILSAFYYENDGPAYQSTTKLLLLYF